MNAPRTLTDALYANDLQRLRRLLDESPELISAELAPGERTFGRRGWRPLHYAAWYGLEELARELLERGAELDPKGEEGRTPLHFAIESGSRVADELLRRGAHVDVCAAAILGRTDRLRELLEGDPSLANDPSTGLSPLGWAAFGNAAASAEVLAGYGADLSEVGPLFCAASVGGRAFLEWMLDHGADPNARTGGQSLLHAAVDMRFHCDASPTVRLLLERGADPDARDAEGRTPLERLLSGRSAPAEDHPAAPPEGSKSVEAVAALLRARGGRATGGPGRT